MICTRSSAGRPVWPRPSQKAFQSKNTSTITWERTADLPDWRQVVVLPASSQGARCRIWLTTSECMQGKPFGHARYLQASEGTERSISSKEEVNPSSYLNRQCNLPSGCRSFGSKCRSQVRSGYLRMPGAHGKNIRRLGRNEGGCPRALPSSPVRGSPARLRFACGCFRASSSRATRREKDLATVSCERSGQCGFDSRKGPRVRKAIFVCCQIPAVPQAAARFCPALEDRPRPDTGCSRLG